MHYDGDADRFVVGFETSIRTYEISPGHRCGCLPIRMAWSVAQGSEVPDRDLQRCDAQSSLLGLVAGRSLETRQPKTAVVANMRAGELVKITRPKMKRRSKTVKPRSPSSIPNR